MPRPWWLCLALLAVGIAWVAVGAVLRLPGDAAAAVSVETVARLGLAAVFAGLAALIAWQQAMAHRWLAGSERHLRGLLAASSDAIVVVRDGRIAFANAAAELLVGLPPGASLIGRDALDLVDPRERADQRARLTRLGLVGQVESGETTLVRFDGTPFEADIAGVAIRFDGRPAVQLMIRDVSDRRAEEREVEASERRLRGLLDGVGLVALSVAGDGTIRFANRAAYELLGRAPGSLDGTSIFELLAFRDEEDARRGLSEVVISGAIPTTFDLAVDLPDGAQRSIRWHLGLSEGDDGGTIVAIGEDMTDAVATSDRLRTLLASAPVGICAVDPDGTVRIADGGPFVRVADVAGGPAASVPAKLDDLPAPFAEHLRRALSGQSTEAQIRYDGRTWEATFTATSGPSGRAGAIGVFVEVTQRTNLEREGDRLATAIDQATDSIVITDASGIIGYVNPAFERVTGYSREEALGQRPSIVKSGVQSESFYKGMWRTITGGRPWTGELVNRRKDGALFRELATITPVRDRDGTIVSFVAVKRDVTRERLLEDALDREVRERAAIVTALERIAVSGGPAEIGLAICEEVVRLPEVGMAGLFVFQDDSAMALAYVGPPEVPVVTGQALPPSRSRYLATRAAEGPWAEPWVLRPEDGEYGERMDRAGVRALAYVPLRDESGLLGVLGLGTFIVSEAQALLDRLPALGAVGAMASSQLSGAVRRAMVEQGARGAIDRVIAARSFVPVFQPVVDLRTGEPLGYEALTRFDGGTRPDIMFGQARAIGLGIALETVTLEAAIAEGRRLPSGAFLALNVSPELALQPGALAEVLRDVGRPIVLEITEHAVIEDYAALRAVTRSLPVTSRLAVDDAGAGFASLRHVLELAPDIVKVDRSITEHIDRDPARQALLAGLRFFAARRRIDLIAEGIETQAQLAALTSLAIPLGQGYLLGRPAPAGTFTGEPIPLTPPHDPGRPIRAIPTRAGGSVRAGASDESRVSSTGRGA